MPALSRNDTDAVDTSIGSTLHPSIDLSRRRRNFLASPLLRLPTELILNIFVHVIESDDYYNHYRHRHNRWPFILTAICHQLREIGTASPQLWTSVDFTPLPIAELFLERCKYNPRILLVKESRFRWPRVTHDPNKEAVWEKLEGRTFNNLRSLVFDGTEREFAHKVVSLLQRAPNISNLDLNNVSYGPSQDLPWPIGDPIPNLSTLRLHNFSIDWTSPLLRNLTRLTLNSGSPRVPPKHVSIETFLAALANCPNLEILELTNSGPEPINSHHDECDVVVQLCRLEELSLEFRDPSTVGYILSHIECTELGLLVVDAPVHVNAELSEVISRILPHRNAQTIQHFRESISLTVNPDDHPQFSTNNVLVRFQEPYINGGPQRNPQGLARFASKIVEVVGWDTIVILDIYSWQIELPEGMWEAFLHGLPLLESICYQRIWEESDLGLVNSFVLVFSRPFEGQPVCPQLEYLDLPRGVLTQDSAAVLKRALTERDTCGRRLKRISVSDGPEAGVDDRLVLEMFRDLVDEVG